MTTHELEALLADLLWNPQGLPYGAIHAAHDELVERGDKVSANHLLYTEGWYLARCGSSGQLMVLCGHTLKVPQ